PVCIICGLCVFTGDGDSTYFRMGHCCHLCLVVARCVFRVVFAEGHWSVGHWRQRGAGWLRRGSSSSPSYATELQIKATRGLFWEMAREYCAIPNEPPETGYLTVPRAVRSLGDAMRTSLFGRFSAADAPILRICISR